MEGKRRKDTKCFQNFFQRRKKMLSKNIWLIVAVVVVVVVAIIVAILARKEGYEEIRGGILDRTEVFNGQNVKYTTLEELRKAQDEFDPTKEKYYLV
jgi:uncharacterized membrane protein YqiK